jgi:hypothetical protein
LDDVHDAVVVTTSVVRLDIFATAAYCDDVPTEGAETAVRWLHGR